MVFALIEIENQKEDLMRQSVRLNATVKHENPADCAPIQFVPGLDAKKSPYLDWLSHSI